MREQHPTFSYSRLSYNRAIIPLIKLQKCVKMKKPLFKDIGNSQGSQDLQWPGAQRKESREVSPAFRTSRLLGAFADPYMA